MTRRTGDGAGLLAAYRAAVENLATHADEINALNVFPVPDGDTGSNMLATVRAALAEAEAVHDPSADRIAQAISFGALMGARGNSGVIASQIFRGMAEGLGGKHHFNGPDLAHALTQGTATAYKAVVKPVEGTILTVIRESAAAASVAAEDGGDLEDVLTAAVEGARQAVARTPSMLPILRDAGVVDAGGEGLYRIMQGALQYLVARTPVVPRTEEPAPARLSTLVVHADEGFGYETMFLLQAREAPLDVDRLRNALETMGESVLVAGDSRAVKVHVHNERPDEVIALGLSMGALTRITVENLDAQSSEVREKRAADVVGKPVEARARAARHEGRPHVELDTYGAEDHVVAATGGTNGSSGPSGAGPAGATALASLAVVAVAAGDGLARIFESFGVAAVVHGGQSNNPSTGELLDAVERIAAADILLLPNNPNVILAARQAAELSHRRVRIVPTRNAAEGFAALLAMDPGRDATVNAEVMTLAGRAIQTLQVTEAVRDATIGGRKVKSGQTIVLDPDDGLLAVNGDRMKAVLAALEALEPGFELITLYYGDAVELAEAESVGRRIAEWRPSLEVETIHGGQPHYRYLIAAE
ncbi:MAG TPA: DAK2 domain-containing protein [Candidatus Limnocylindrales bacterium]